MIYEIDDLLAEIARLNHALRAKSDELIRARTEIQLLQASAGAVVAEQLLRDASDAWNSDEVAEPVAVSYVRALEAVAMTTLGALPVPADGWKYP